MVVHGDVHIEHEPTKDHEKKKQETNEARENIGLLSHSVEPVSSHFQLIDVYHIVALPAITTGIRQIECLQNCSRCRGKLVDVNHCLVHPACLVVLLKLACALTYRAQSIPRIWIIRYGTIPYFLRFLLSPWLLASMLFSSVCLDKLIVGQRVTLGLPWSYAALLRTRTTRGRGCTRWISWVDLRHLLSLAL